MKFGKKLRLQLDHALPGWKPHFLCYKLLKKRLKLVGKAALMTMLSAAIFDENQSIEEGFVIPVPVDELSGGEEREGQKRKTDDVFVCEEQKKLKLDVAATESFPETQESSDRLVQEQCNLIFKENVTEGLKGTQEHSVSVGQEQETSPRRLTEKDENFLRLVKSELHKFNAFFLAKEEDFLIRLSILEERTDAVKEKLVASGGVCGCATYEELIQVHRQIVRLHGEMILLMNYSSLNYVGLLKILKKYDKHTKSNLRQLVHGSVLQQPFFSLTHLKEMVSRSLACEDSLQYVFPTPENVVEPVGSPLARDVAANDSSQSDPVPRHILAALETLQEIH